MSTYYLSAPDLTFHTTKDIFLNRQFLGQSLSYTAQYQLSLQGSTYSNFYQPRVYLAILCTFHFSQKSEKNIQFFAKKAKNAKNNIIRKYPLKFSTFSKNAITGYIRENISC